MDSENDSRLLIRIDEKLDISCAQNKVDHATMVNSVGEVRKELKAINGQVTKNMLAIAQNKDRITTQWKIGGWVMAIFGMVIVALVVRTLLGG